MGGLGTLFLQLVCKNHLVYTDEVPIFTYICNLFQKITNGRKKSIGDGCQRIYR